MSDIFCKVCRTVFGKWSDGGSHNHQRITNAIRDLHSLVLEKLYLNLRNTCAKTMVCPRHIKCAKLC